MSNQIIISAEEFRKKHSKEGNLKKKLNKAYGKNAPDELPTFSGEPFPAEMLIEGQGLNHQILCELSYALAGEFHYCINLMPRPTPRPRAGKGFGGKARVFNDPKYTAYKESLISILGMMGIERPEKPFQRIYMEFGLPYPKSIKNTRKEIRRIDKAFHLLKPDGDNFCKAIQDALEQANIVHADGGIAVNLITKRYTLRPTGYIKFSLY